MNNLVKPLFRPRRLRQNAAVRRLVAETRLSASELILPMFVAEGITEPRPISSMPGVVQHTKESLQEAAREALDLGVGAIMLFGVPLEKDAIGSCGTDPNGILAKGVRWVREVDAEIPIIGDLCLDEFTDHGHCGVLGKNGQVDNDATLERYADMAVVLADAGTTMVGPSGMMDGQVAAVRQALDAAGHIDTAIFAYSAKYASAFYGPFREAVQSSLKGDRRTYQQDPANVREALREVQLDVDEGADIVMVKPALAYLDVVAQVYAMTDVPVAAYVVSGEYAMIEFAAAAGTIDRDRAIVEALTGVKRAGASLIVTYWAAEVARWIGEGKLS